MSFQESWVDSGSQTVQVIGAGRRLVAYLIDGVILAIIQFVIIFCASFVIGLAAGEGEAGGAIGLLFNCLSILIAAAYFIVFWAMTGQTPGKMAMGIKVIGVDGMPVSWGKAVLRYLGYLVSGLVLSIGFIWAAFDSKRQGWHDKIAGTYVVPKETTFSAADNVTFTPSDQGSAVPIILVVIYVVGLILVPIFVIAILLLLGPVVGNVFSNIVNELQTPTP